MTSSRNTSCIPYPSPLTILSFIFTNLPKFIIAYNNFSINPVNNFCGRWLSGSIVKNDMLYIDGGIQKYYGPDVPVPVFGDQNWFIQIPLEVSWDWKTNIVINAVPKNESNPKTGTLPPSRGGHIMFQGPSNKSDVYIFGGTTYMNDPNFQGYVNPDSSTYPLWSYTPGAGKDSWNQFDISQPRRPNHGAATEAVDQGLAFYLNGQIDWGTDGQIDSLRNTSLYTPLDGMLILNLVDQTSVNITTPGISGGGSRVGAKMEYVSPVGGKGIIIAMGGQVNRNKLLANQSEGAVLDFNTVDVFDIESYLISTSTNGTWYTQKTTGDVPEPRIDFCLVTVASLDNSSYHIYLYGGINPVTTTIFDDVFILSLPSFTWTNVFRNGQTPRWGHNCHRVGKRQMITVGGNITTEDCDWEEKGVAFLDMSTITWGSVFLPNTSEYQVPSKLLSTTGGTVTGGGTKKEPSLGWTDPGLGKVWRTARRWGNASSQTTQKPHVGVIAGGVIGGVVGIILIAGVLIFLRWKQRSSKSPYELENVNVARLPGELSNEERKHELDAGPFPKELDAPRQTVEAPSGKTTRFAELPGTNVVQDRKYGDPIVSQETNTHV